MMFIDLSQVLYYGLHTVQTSGQRQQQNASPGKHMNVVLRPVAPDTSPGPDAAAALGTLKKELKWQL